MELSEFRGRVFDALIRIHEVCDANPSVRQQALPQDARELLSIVRTPASELILCASVDEAINRLKQDQLKLGAVEYVSSEALSDPEIESAMLLAYAKETQDTPSLPCFAFCAYLIELCDGLKPGKGPAVQ
jgi:hypothetical protein